MPRRSAEDITAKRCVDVNALADQYLRGRRDRARYASFDYCFNYFQSFYEDDRAADLAGPRQLEFSCLQLGFYLASWGMFRGRAKLLQHSAKSLEPAVRVIAAAPEAVWRADADDYIAPVRDALINAYKQLSVCMPGGESHTLVTKAMLGVFGCVPAFDRYFREAFAVSTFGLQSLLALEAYYWANAEAIDSHRVPTIDFATGGNTNRYYTRAKVIDMVFFTKGLIGGSLLA